MSNEIKQGDKVRVSRDIPQFYLEYNSYRMFEIEHRVVDVNMEDGFALLDSIPPKFTTILPTKYLVKVDAEAKEPKFKVGEEMFWLPSKTIRYKCTITEVIKNEHSGKWEYNVLFEWGKPGKWIPESELALYTEPTAPKFKVGDRIKFKNIYELQKVKDKSFRWMLVMFASKEATITAVEDNGFYRVDIDPSIGGINDDMIECKVEPIATKYKVGDWVMISGVLNPQLNGMIGWISRIDKDGNKVSFQDGRFAIVEDKYLTLITQPTEQTEAEKPNHTIKIPVEVDLTDSYWDAYAADLAREIAVKSMEKSYGCDPERIAEYAVSVAKSVVEGLKRK